VIGQKTKSKEQQLLAAMTVEAVLTTVQLAVTVVKANKTFLVKVTTINRCSNNGNKQENHNSKKQ